VVGRVEESAGQGPVTGPFPFTPVQRLFLNADPIDPHQFDQPVLLNVRHSQMWPAGS
jgi:hypothetical protein